jgi:hypothetical protein
MVVFLAFFFENFNTLLQTKHALLMVLQKIHILQLPRLNHKEYNVWWLWWRLLFFAQFVQYHPSALK